MRAFVSAALIAAFCCAAVSGAAPVQAAAPAANTQLAGAIAAIVRRPAFAHATFGIAVYDLDTKRTTYALNATKFFKPASTTKTLTEGTSLALLGPDFRFTTPVYRTGPVDASGTLHGDLVLVASGDPNLSQRIQPDGTLAFENEDHSYDGSPATKAVPGDPLAVLADLARQVAASGIKAVTGRVVVDASLFPPAGREAGTGAYVSPVVVNDNLIDVTVTPGKSAGDPATIAVSPQTPYATFVDRAVTGAAKSRNTLDMRGQEDANGDRRVVLTGSVPSTDPPTLYAYRVPSPTRFAEQAFTQTLQAAGVQVAAPPADPVFERASYAASYVPADLVAKHVSPPLREDVRVTLKVSDNLHAALMPYLWGAYAAHAKTGQLRAGFALERQMLRRAGLDLSQAAQSDGLGGKADFTPAFMVRYLAWVREQSWSADFYRALPILGVDGTLYDVQTNAPAKGKVHAKTGAWGFTDLLNRVGFVEGRGLVGYTTTRAGHHVAIALYLNDYQGRRGEDAENVSIEALGELANAIYLHG